MKVKAPEKPRKIEKLRKVGGATWDRLLQDPPGVWDTPNGGEGNRSDRSKDQQASGISL